MSCRLLIQKLRSDGDGKGREKRRNVLNFYRDELRAVLSLDKELICTQFCTLACVVLKSLGYLETASLLHASSACSAHRVNRVYPPAVAS